MSKETESKHWVQIVVAIILAIGAMSVCGVPVVTRLLDIFLPASVTSTPIPPPAATQQAQCQWLQNNFPQSSQEVKARFGLLEDTAINFIYELCPSAANALGFKAKAEIQLQVPLGGCIDSWPGFTKYVGDVGTPVPDGWGGWRVYKGTVRSPEMTYRIMGCK